MRFAVFGASGRTGRLVLDGALAGGHSVTALVRRPGSIARTHPELTIVEGDVRDAAATGRVLAGAGAVISTLSSGQGVLTAFAETAIPAMERLGILRLVSLVGAGVEQPGDTQSVGRSIMLTLMRTLARDMASDAAVHAKLVIASRLDWTLVRPPRLTDGPLTGKLRHAPAQPMGPFDSIGRADLAAFMIELAAGRSYVRQSPMVTAL